jgi:hypothetical protein
MLTISMQCRSKQCLFSSSPILILKNSRCLYSFIYLSIEPYHDIIIYYSYTTFLIIQGGACLRFFKRKTHPETLLNGKFHYTVFGLGDSNLLLDRQSTGAKDCNQVAQELDMRLEVLGGDRHYALGVSDERTGLTEVEPWIDGFWNSLMLTT